MVFIAILNRWRILRIIIKGWADTKKPQPERTGAVMGQFRVLVLRVLYVRPVVPLSARVLRGAPGALRVVGFVRGFSALNFGAISATQAGV